MAAYGENPMATVRGTTGWIALTFLAPMFAGDQLSCKGVVLAPKDREDAERLELEVWIENQDGVKIAVGWIGARV